MNQYFAVWGVNSTLVDYLKENPYIELYEVKEDQSGMFVTAITDGEGEPFKLDMTFGKPKSIIHPTLGSEVDITATVVAPNTLQLVYDAKADGILDIHTLTFTPLGIQVFSTKKLQQT